MADEHSRANRALLGVGRDTSSDPGSPQLEHVTTPLEDLASATIIGIFAVFVWGVAVYLSGLDGGLVPAIFLGLAALVPLGGAVYAARRGIRLWRWRRRNIDQTGGSYVRPWETNPRGNGRL